jgi:hypothetical protein
MSFNRSIFVALATVFVVGMAPSAFAQCCGYQAPAPTYYAPAPLAQGCGSCGVTAYAPIVYATPIAPAPIILSPGCGVCGTPTAAVTFAPPVAPTPVFGGGCGGCGSQPMYAQPVYNAPAPLYVVNQGPEYSGPGVTVPFETYAPPAQYAPPPYYPPYISHPHSYYRGGYGYRGAPAYYRHAYYHPHTYYGRRPYPYPHRYWRG